MSLHDALLAELAAAADRARQARHVLARAGIALPPPAGPERIGLARIRDAGGGLWIPDRAGAGAVLIAEGDFDPVPGGDGWRVVDDLVAVPLARPGTWLRRTGSVPLLNAPLLAPGGFLREPVLVHPTPFDWLAGGAAVAGAEAGGVCVLDWTAPLLPLFSGSEIVAADAATGRRRGARPPAAGARRRPRLTGFSVSVRPVPERRNPMPSTDALPARSAALPDSVPDPRALFDGGIPVGNLAPDAPPDNPHGERAPRIPPLHVEDFAAFLARPIPPRGMLLDPVIPEQGLAMLYSERGVGKTHCSLGMAFAVATGGTFLRWTAPRPRRTVVVDGEMPAALLQERLAAILRAAAPVAPADGYLRLVSPDLQDAPMPDLSTAEGQARFAPVFDRADLVVLDNLSTLCHAGKENEAESWTVMQRFLLDLRRRGKSVLICHHAGKGGGQRGTSKREDALDVVLALRRPPDYAAADGARFEIHLEKARHVFGAAARPFEAKLEREEDGDGGGAARWTVGEVASAHYDEVRGYIAQGLSVRRISALTGLSRSVVGRLRREIVADAVEADEAGDEGEGRLF